MASFNVIMEQMVATMTAVRTNMAPELAGRWTAVDCGLDEPSCRCPSGERSLPRRVITSRKAGFRPENLRGAWEYPTCPDDLMGQAAQRRSTWAL